MTSPRPTASLLYRFALLALVLAAFALRLYRLDAESLWYDEGVTVYVAGLNPVALTRWTAADIQPPLYYYVVAAWGRLAGWSEWALRAPSVFFGTLLVPLLAMVAMRLFRQRSATLLAALITTVHPFLLYYSQEARNYALLLALGTLTAYCLLRVAYRVEADQGEDRRLWVGYLLAATAAMYTHYFAAFLILALVLVGLIPTPRTASPRRHLAQLFSSHLVLLLLYTPWLFVMLRQLGGDASYLPGPFRLDQALEQLATSALYGETYLPWALGARIPLAIATLLALVVLFRRSRVALLITLLWVIAPTAGVLALAGVVPKFNVRYASLALPGLILLWGGGLSWRPSAASSTPALGHRFTHHALRITQLVALGLLAASFLHANRFWADPTFITRSQWRETAAYIRDHREPGDAVVLSSGHAWPVWDYYAPDIPALRLPDIDVLDVNQALGYTEAGEILRDGLAGADRAWLVEWQDEVLDPMGVVPLHLAEAGKSTRLEGIHSQRGDELWHIDLSRYDDIAASAINPEPPRNLNINFGDQIVLLGSELIQSSRDTLRLFWQLAPGIDGLKANYRISGEITFDSDTYGTITYAALPDQRPAAYVFPSSRWQPSQVIVGGLGDQEELYLPTLEDVMPGALPGSYTLRLTLYDPASDVAGLDVLGSTGAPLGKRAAIPFSLDRIVSPGTDVPLPEPVDHIRVGSLRAYVLDPTDENPWSPREMDEALVLEAGAPQRLAIGWSLEEATQPVPFVLRWYAGHEPASTGEAFVHEEAAEIEGATAWLPRLPGGNFREIRLLQAPSNLPAGDYRVQFERVIPQRPEQTSALWWLPVTVLVSTRTFDLPPLAQSTAAIFSDAALVDAIELAGLIDPLPDLFAADEQLSLTLAWRALDTPAANYSVTVQFLNDAGQPVAQADAPLPGGSRSWLAGEVVTQTLELVGPSEPGTYRVIAAVYEADAPGQPRLSTESGVDFVELGTLEISSATSAPAASGNDWGASQICGEVRGPG